MSAVGIHYSRGRHIRDNLPVQRRAADMAEFINLLDADRAPQKAGAAYVCGPLGADGRRCLDHALPRAWLALDLDRIDAPLLPDVFRWAAGYDGCGWMTHSSTLEAPRARIVVGLDRPADRSECIAIGVRVEQELKDRFGNKVKLDTSTFRPEQPVHVPPTEARIQRFTGEPLAVMCTSQPTRAVLPSAGEPSSPTEEAQRNSEVVLSSSVPPLSSSVGAVDWQIPTDTIPTEEGQRNACLFRLARHVRARFPCASNAELRAVVQRWHALSRPVIGTTDFSVTLTDFLRGFGKVRQPFGTVMQDVLSHIDEDQALPAGLAELGYGLAGNRLVRICAALQERSGSQPFFLSARQAGELVGVHFTDASKTLSTFVFDGVLELVTRGSGRAASRYRFVWAPNR